VDAVDNRRRLTASAHSAGDCVRFAAGPRRTLRGSILGLSLYEGI
jgi:hypothetical protein